MDESTIYKNKAAILDVFYTVLYKNNENISPNPKTLLGVYVFIPKWNIFK